MNLDSKYFDRLRTKRKGPAAAKPADAETAVPECQWDGCHKPGKHKAPVGRNAEGQFFLFCFEHVKAYNKGYNYFEGLSDSEIARYQKEALTGHRPTWTVGVNGDTRKTPLNGSKKAGNAASGARMRDPFGFVHDGRDGRPQRPKRERKLKTLEAKAFDTLERLDQNPEYWDGKRGACVGAFQMIIAGKERKETLREILSMLKSSRNPQVEYLDDAHTDPDTWRCTPCPPGANCGTLQSKDGKVVACTTATLAPVDGWWRVSQNMRPDSVQPFAPCPYPEHCNEADHANRL